MYVRYYGLQKTWLDDCLKTRVRENPWTSNMVNRLNRWGNLNDSTFTISFDR